MANFLHGRAPTFIPSKLIYEFIQNIYTPTHTIYRHTISNIYLHIWYLQHIWYANQLKHDFGIRLAYPQAQCRQLWILTVQGNITLTLEIPFFSSEFSNFQNWIWNCVALYCNTWTCLEAFEFMFQKVWQVGHSFSFLELYVCVSEAFRLIVLCRNFEANAERSN